MKRLLAVGAVLAVAMLGGASFAWACAETTGPYLNSLSPNAGDPGTQTVVSGGGWTDGAISIRWASPTGTEIGTTSGRSFSSRVTVPANATRGQVTYVYAVQGSVSRATPFEVKSAPKATTNDGSNQGGSSSGSTSGGTEESEAETGTDSTSGGSTSNDSTNDSTSNKSDNSTNSGTQGGQSGQPATASPSSGMPTPAAGTSSADAGTKTATASGTGTAASPRTGALAARTAGPAATATAPSDAPAPTDNATAESLRSSSSNLWSGFADDPSARRLTSLDDLQGTQSGPPGVAIALALFTGGLLALLGGFGLAEARRRKVTAGAR